MAHVKMLMVVTALVTTFSIVVVTGTASAEKLCTEQKIECPAGKHEAKGTVTQRSLIGSFLVGMGMFSSDTCTENNIKGRTTNTAVAGERLKYNNESYTFGKCTFTTTAISLGKEEVAHIAGTNNGTLFSSELEVTINTVLFGSCVYGTGAGTDMGTVQGGNPATVKTNTTVSKLSGSAFACPGTATWEAEYMITEPKPIWIAKN